ncbi:MAG: helix-turn-helix domain-containing protein [Oscillospiraceae bacterium]|nr:helix-turn-helix domain-containing protein [Oscillospiraceae bacterium]
MTQTEVAEYLKTTQSYYAQYERNARQMTLERAAELAILYNVSLDFIAGLSDNINRGYK